MEHARMTWAGAALFAAWLQLASALAAGCAAQQTPAAVAPGTVSPMLFGTHMLFNQATDRLRAKPAFMASLAAVPVHSLRFPGGTIGDNYLWDKKQTARADWFPFNYTASPGDLDFDEFIAAAHCLGAQPTIVLNLRHWVASGQVEEGFRQAEDWVRYARDKGYSVRYWELGNELYGKKAQEQAPLPARQYGAYYAELRKRLKAIDPGVELGLVVAPKPDMIAPGDREAWWKGAIAGAGGDIDYVVIHRYVVEPPRALARKGSTYDETLAAARATLNQLLGHDAPIHLTEWNLGSRSAGRQGPVKHDTIGHALFVADAVVDQADSGVRLATFWPLLGPKEQGMLDKNTLALNAPGQVMRLLSPLAGWRVLQKAEERGGLQWSIYGTADGRRAAVLINWQATPASFDWNRTVGNCAASGTVIAADGAGEQAMDSGIAKSNLTAENGAVSLPGFATALLTSPRGKRCGP